MRPVLFDAELLGRQLAPDSYAVFVWAGAVAALALALVLVRLRGLPFARSAAVLVAAAVALPVGARLLHVITDLPLFVPGPGDMFAPALTGFALYGGLLVAIEVAVAGAWLARVDLWKLADAAAPGIALGIALAKTGCFLEGCCHGVVTAGVLGVTFPLGSPAHAAQLIDGTAGPLGPVLPVLPVQLFEVVGALAFGLAALLLPRRAPDGVGFLVLAAGFSAVRWAVLPVRWLEPSFASPAWFYPAFYAAIIVACAVLAAARVRAAEQGTPASVTVR